MSDGRWGVQAAVYGALIDANICNGRVFAPAIQNYDVFPYVEIGESDSQPDDTSGSDSAVKEGLAEFMTLHVWSRVNSYSETKEIISAIRDALHDVTLTVTGRTRAYSQVQSDRIFRDQNGITIHGVVQLRILHHA